MFDHVVVQMLECIDASNLNRADELSRGRIKRYSQDDVLDVPLKSHAFIYLYVDGWVIL